MKKYSFSTFLISFDGVGFNLADALHPNGSDI